MPSVPIDGRGASTHRGDDVRGEKTRTVCQLHRPAAAAGGRQRDSFRIRQQGDGCALAGHSQHVEYRGSGHCARIDAVILHGGHQAERGKERGHFAGRRDGVHLFNKRRGLAVMRGLHIQVGQVAAAVACRQQFFAYARQTFYDRDVEPSAAQRSGGAQAACPAA